MKIENELGLERIAESLVVLQYLFSSSSVVNYILIFN